MKATTRASLTTIQAQDPLPSWNDGKAKRSITAFVAKVTKEGSPDFVPVAERIATFDNDGKAIGINQHIGRRPIAAFGNSDGDREMLEYTKAGAGVRLAMLVLHDDAAREYAYGPAQGLPDTKMGAFTPALYEQAKQDGWTVISMKDDWKPVFAFEK
jgi:hypothetical protein